MKYSVHSIFHKLNCTHDDIAAMLNMSRSAVTMAIQSRGKSKIFAAPVLQKMSQWINDAEAISDPLNFDFSHFEAEQRNKMILDTTRKKRQLLESETQLSAMIQKYNKALDTYTLAAKMVIPPDDIDYAICENIRKRHELMNLKTITTHSPLNQGLLQAKIDGLKAEIAAMEKIQ
jgi:predicted transcriptional regulator